MQNATAGALPQPGPVFEALPEPAPLPQLPRPAPQLQAAMPDEASSMAAMAPMAAPAGEGSAQLQVHLRLFSDFSLAPHSVLLLLASAYL